MYFKDLLFGLPLFSGSGFLSSFFWGGGGCGGAGGGCMKSLFFRLFSDVFHGSSSTDLCVSVFIELLSFL